MLQPINYSLNVKTPFEAAVEGYKVGLAGQEALAQRQALEAQRAKALAEVEKARAEATRMANYQASLQKLRGNPNPTAQDFIDLSISAPESERTNAKAVFDMMTDAQKQDRLKVGGQILSALNANRPEVAIATLTERAAAYKNAGDEPNAKATQELIDNIKANPADAKIILGATMGDIPEFKDVLTASLKANEVKDPWVVVPGVGVFPRVQLERIAKAAEAEGSPEVTLTANIPDGAVAELRAGKVSKAAFDSVFGAGKADKILGVKK
jgi:hypothetical protein